MQGAAAVCPSGKVISSASNNLHRAEPRDGRTPGTLSDAQGESAGVYEAIVTERSHSESMSSSRRW